MSTKRGLQLIIDAGREVSLEENFLPRAIRALIKFGGVDSEKLSPEDVVAAIEDRDDAPWSDLWWSLDETVGYFALIESPEEWTEMTRVLVFIYGVAMSHSLRRGHGDVDFAFDKICGMITAFGRFDPIKRFPVMQRVRLLHYVLKHLPSS
jgi:hypothetical protein